jgi:serine protease Do
MMINKFLGYIFLFVVLSVTSCSSKDDRKVYEESENRQESNRSLDQLNSEINSSRHNSITRAVRMAEDAIVGINVTETRQVVYRDPFSSFFDDPYFRQFFGDRQRQYTQEYQVQGLGSGFIISPDGYILTNHHVAGNASKVVVTMTDGTKHNAELIGSDMTSDVALLKIDGSNLPYLKLGNSEDIIIGEWVIAFGNPFGLFDLNAKPTVTVGVISNSGVNFTQEGRVYKEMLQTDAAISSGNSGGPLVNALGEVVGMNTVIFSTSQSRSGAGSIGIGWAIPVNRIKKVLDLLIKDKKINRNFDIGIEVSNIDEDLARYLGIQPRDGVIVISVNTRKVGGKAGIEPGDIIIGINGKKVDKDTDYFLNVNDAVVGDELKLNIIRDGEQISRTVKLSEQGNLRGR